MSTDPDDERDRDGRDEDSDPTGPPDASGPEGPADVSDPGGAADEADTAGPPGAEPGDASAVSDEEQTWAILTHVSAFAGLVVPLGNVLAPLVVWLIKKDESSFVDANGKQALNFQLTWTIAMIVALLTLLVGIGVVLVPLVALGWVILVVLATIRASEREVYDYPLTIDFVS